MGINNLSDLLKDVKIEPAHKPSIPNPTQTPKPEKTKVAKNPVRIPVNKQTALLVAPVRCWASQPIPDPPERKVDPKAFAQVQADLKTERNDHAETRDELGRERQKVAELRRLIKDLDSKIMHLEAKVKEQQGIIDQLEDIKL